MRQQLESDYRDGGGEEGGRDNRTERREITVQGEGMIWERGVRVKNKLVKECAGRKGVQRNKKSNEGG